MAGLCIVRNAKTVIGEIQIKCGFRTEAMRERLSSFGRSVTAQHLLLRLSCLRVSPGHLRCPFASAPWQPTIAPARADAIYPQSFSMASASQAVTEIYLADPLARKLLEFFEAKGLRALKEEDRLEQWYEDWLAHQAQHRLYATLLAPREFSSFDGQFDLLRLTRFLEMFGYCSPAHGYSLQVSFLGLFAILMGDNPALKLEAVQVLEAGELLAFAISEKDHGADLLGNEFSVRQAPDGRLVANGSKYYIGNCNRAAIITTLARDGGERSSDSAATRRARPILIALRPKQSPLRNVRKIHTLGVRAAFVGEFEVRDHQLSSQDLIARGRDAWDAVLGTVALGKFLLGFGSIGICERALQEASGHLSRRKLYGKPAIDMPHISSRMAQAYARLMAMKLYAYRSIDYVHAASAEERRYLLFCAVQKAKVSTEGVKVMALLSQCIGAKGFESDTFFEMALRDIQLIPSLEGSTHINLALAAQFIGGYFGGSNQGLPAPKSLVAGEVRSDENPYLFEARGSFNTVGFNDFLDAYKPLFSIPNVRLLAQQAEAFEQFNRNDASPPATDTESVLARANCFVIIAYAQLIAENSTRLKVPNQIVSVIFDQLVLDLGASGVILASSAALQNDPLLQRMTPVPQTAGTDWEFVARRVAHDVQAAEGT